MARCFVYVHGLNSFPASAKARVLREKLESLGRGAEFRCPALSHWPLDAAAALERAVEDCAPGEVMLIGSSLGGYYATWLAERGPYRVALINPAVRPYELFAQFLGRQKNLYTGEEYDLTERHLQELQALEVERLTHPERYLLMVTTGDEVLDYRRAVERYRGAFQIVAPGGDHGFSGFADYLGVILDFAQTAKTK